MAYQNKRFDERIRRTLAALRSRSVVTGRTVAAFSGASLRQTYRDIDYLRDLGYSIEGEAGYGMVFGLRPSAGLRNDPYVFMRSRSTMKVVAHFSAGRWPYEWTNSSEIAGTLDVSEKNVSAAVFEAKRAGIPIQSCKTKGYKYAPQSEKEDQHARVHGRPFGGTQGDGHFPQGQAVV